MVFRDNRDPGLLPDHNAVQMLVVEGIGDDREVRKSPREMLQNIVRASVPHLIPHHRKFFGKSRDPSRGDIRCPAFHHSERNGSRKTVLHVREIAPCLVRKREHLIRPVQKKASGLGQLQVALPADEQLNAQIFLEAFDLIRKRRLTHIQLLGGSREIQFLRDNGKILKCSEIHTLRLSDGQP